MQIFWKKKLFQDGSHFCWGPLRDSWLQAHSLIKTNCTESERPPTVFIIRTHKAGSLINLATRYCTQPVFRAKFVSTLPFLRATSFLDSAAPLVTRDVIYECDAFWAFPCYVHAAPFLQFLQSRVSVHVTFI